LVFFSHIPNKIIKYRLSTNDIINENYEMRGQNMSEDNRSKQDPQNSQRLTSSTKTVLIFSLSLFVLSLLCIILLWEVNNLKSKLNQVTDQLTDITLFLQSKYYSREADKTKTPGTDNNAQTGQYPEDMDESIQVQAVSGGAQLAETDQITDAAHKVYLTFDDGPGSNTLKILDILDQYDIKATFFVIGKEDAKSVELLNEIVERGHTLGMHSYSHKYRAIYNSVEDFAEDFHKLQDYLYESTGVLCTCYRFPGGSSNSITDIDILVFAAYLKEQGVEYYDWNISSGDGAVVLQSVETIVKNCTANIGKQETSIVLMHDSPNKSTTLEALPIIIERILDMEDTVFLPITEDTAKIQHVK